MCSGGRFSGRNDGAEGGDPRGRGGRSFERGGGRGFDRGRGRGGRESGRGSDMASGYGGRALPERTGHHAQRLDLSGAASAAALTPRQLVANKGPSESNEAPKSNADFRKMLLRE